MRQCSSCGKKSIILEKLNDIEICPICGLKLKTKLWKYKKYSSNEEIDLQKNEIIRIAEINNFDSVLINNINDFFESKKMNGLVVKVVSKYISDLTVYEDYIEINFSNNFMYTEANKSYKKMKSGQRGKGLTETAGLANIAKYLDSNTATTLITGVMTKMIPGGGLIKTGLKAVGKNYAISALTNKLSDINSQDNKALVRNIDAKDIRIKMENIVSISLTKPFQEDMFGFLEIVCDDNIRSDGDIVYVFDSSKSTEELVRKAYMYISEKIEKYNVIRLEKIEKEQSELAQKEEKLALSSNSNNNFNNNSNDGVSTADQILKYKELLDVGAITEEEFSMLKKKLLGL